MCYWCVLLNIHWKIKKWFILAANLEKNKQQKNVYLANLYNTGCILAAYGTVTSLLSTMYIWANGTLRSNNLQGFQ